MFNFADLPPQPPLYPESATIYAQSTLERSQAASMVCEVVPDQQFGPDDLQSLDIYLAKRSATSSDAPVLVFAHGGAWTNGYKEWMGLMAPALTAAGITFVSVSYRLAPQQKWDAMRDDCLDAIAWVHRHIAGHGGDPRRIAVGGHSAGGHLMALAALDSSGLAARGVPRSAVCACLPLCAPLDIRYPHREPGSGEERTHQMILGHSSEGADASPVCQVTGDAPFMLLAYARDDLPRIVNGVGAMAAELERHRVAHETLVLEGDHFSAALAVEDPASAWTRRVIRLLRGSD
jgi:arylformamidase